MVHNLLEDETRSHIAGAPAALSGARVIAIWDGGTASCALPDSGKVLIGRSMGCDLRIVNSSVSREHAVISIGSPNTIQDLGSSNGTRVENQLLEPGQRAPIRPGNVVEVGSALLLLQDALETQVHPAPTASGPAVTLPPAADTSRMAQVRRLAKMVASSSISVILSGETGVGKEVLAKLIHDNSPRRDKPFLRINCAAFAESMVESELFGHEKGSFTGAHQTKAGLLEAANGGTLLLDEVGELPLAMQAKLLRAIGNREVLRVGASKPRPIDVRFLAATHRDLEAQIEHGGFRADLYFRLNGITLEIPPLRERQDEITPLAEQFALEEAGRLGFEAPVLTEATRNTLLSYAWPGNIRELASAIARAVLLSQGAPITPEHLTLTSTRPEPEANVAPGIAELAAPQAHATALGASQLKDEVKELERRRIVDAMAECGGNQTKAARLLGISRRALLHRLDAYGLPRPRKGVPKRQQ